MAKVREMVLPAIDRHGPIDAWIIDDTGFPKQGRHSVGVARQYCGQLGKQDNCQVAVSLSIANHHASLPVAYQLYFDLRQMPASCAKWWRGASSTWRRLASATKKSLPTGLCVF